MVLDIVTGLGIPVTFYRFLILGETNAKNENKKQREEALQFNCPWAC